MDELILKVKVIPNAHKNAVVGMRGDVLVVRLAAPPVDGKANASLLEFVARQLNLRKQQVHLQTGQKSRYKMIKLQGLDKEQVVRLILSGSEE